jgi:hypothetical protein
MKKSLTDPVVRAAKKWLKLELQGLGEVGGSDGAIVVYNLVKQFHMTAAQYWQVADEGVTLMPSSYLSPWLALQVWKSLSDWDGTGSGLASLSAGATLFLGKDFASTSSRVYMLERLRAHMSEITPNLTWGETDLKEWLTNEENPLTSWTAADIKALPLRSHADLLMAYLRRPGAQGHFKEDAVRLLIDSQQWSAEQIQSSIGPYMRGSTGSGVTAQAMLVLEAWLGTLEWTPENAEAHALQLYEFLTNEKLPGWERLLPHVGKGLACLADNPGELQRIVNLVSNVPSTNVMASRLIAMLLASVNAALPENLVLQAITKGALMMVLENKSYTITQRLTWLKEYAGYVLAVGAVISYMERFEQPIKDAINLWCFMQAANRTIPPSVWVAAGKGASEAAKKEFMDMDAPGVADQLKLVQTLGLSYADAVDMLIDTGNGGVLQPMLDLPEIDESHTHGPSGEM